MVSKEICNESRGTKKEIEKKKRLIADYVRIAPALGISPEEQERQVNLMLDDLVKLLKQKK